ncbi:MAG: putative porin [Verrucomicrobiota bacterium]|nr:putative porin [Verrucomicrobiota bacterium]
MKKVKIAIVVALTLSLNAFSQENVDVARQIAELKAEFQNKINALTAKLEAQEEKIDKKISESPTDGVKIAFSKGIERLKFKNDIRLRFERRHRYDDGRRDERDRFRYRLRIGAEYKASDDLMFGVRLASGGGGETSTNESANLDKDGIYIDKAYVKYTGLKNSTAIAGKMGNPFNKNKMIFDTDYTPEGIAYVYKQGIFKATAGAFIFGSEDSHYGNDDPNSENEVMYGLQLQIKAMKNLKLGASYYHFNNEVEHASGGNQIGVDMHIAELYADLKVNDNFSLYAKGIQNMALSGSEGSQDSRVDPNDKNDLGYEAGLKFKKGKFKGGYTYRHLESDACWNALNDSDFGDNRKGHIITLAYKVNNNFSIGLTQFFTDEIDTAAGNDERDEQLTQIDAKFKF